MRSRRQGIAEMLDDGKHYDPENMNSMARPYKMQCEMAKFAYNYNPFGPHGHGIHSSQFLLIFRNSLLFRHFDYRISLINNRYGLFRRL
jgi:hypothetical protein